MKILKNKKISTFSTFGIGGRAEYFCEAHTKKELFLAFEFAKAKKTAYKLFAGGSNVVFPDGVMRGLLIRIKGGTIQRLASRRLYVGAGVPLSRLITHTIASGLAGLEALSGIPGTVGGALVGNAGAYGHSIEEVVLRVRVWNGKKEMWIGKNECKFAYRESIFKYDGLVVLGAELLFKKESIKKLRETSRRIIAERLAKYPNGLMCPGSYFKNVLVGDISPRAFEKIDMRKITGGKVAAGYLLEAAGAKGMRYGGVGVAEYHGNLILNYGKGTAKDAKALAATLKRRVRMKFGIELQEEVKYL